MLYLLRNFLVNILLLGAVINVISALELEGLQRQMNKSKNKSTTSKPSSATLPSSVSIYRVNATNGATCILISTDALLSIQYRDKLNEDKEADVYLTDDVDVTGECYEDEANMRLALKGFVLSIYFKKTPGGERWYVSSMELTYSSSNSKFEHIDRPKLDVKLSTPSHNTLLFPTPVGKAYTCDIEQNVTMYSQDENDKSGHLAKLYLRELKMQSFMYKAANTFGPSFQCTASGTYRDETAPIAVGSTLAVVVLCTVTGYGLWRYFKVKKVQYGTME